MSFLPWAELGRLPIPNWEVSPLFTQMISHVPNMRTKLHGAASICQQVGGVTNRVNLNRFRYVGHVQRNHYGLV